MIRADLAQDAGPHRDLEPVDESLGRLIEHFGEDVELELDPDDRRRREDLGHVDAERADPLAHHLADARRQVAHVTGGRIRDRRAHRSR